MKKTKKITSSHSTYIEAALGFITLAQKDTSVTKISVGIIKVVKTSTDRRIKCNEEDACLVLKVRGNRAIQELRFYTQNHLELRRKVEKLAKDLSFKITQY